MFRRNATFPGIAQRERQRRASYVLRHSSTNTLDCSPFIFLQAIWYRVRVTSTTASTLTSAPVSQLKVPLPYFFGTLSDFTSPPSMRHLCSAPVVSRSGMSPLLTSLSTRYSLSFRGVVLVVALLLRAHSCVAPRCTRAIGFLIWLGRRRAAAG